MCTIGSVLKENSSLTFKQCDLINRTTFYDPVIINGHDNIKYLKFGREGNLRKLVWNK